MEITQNRFVRFRLSGESGTWLLTASLMILGSLYPAPNIELSERVVTGLLWLAPVVALSALLAGALTLGNWSTRALTWVNQGPVRAVLLASFTGAITPVCGLGVLPLIVTLLRQNLPLAPIMAFWVSSPIMGPSMLPATIAILGLPFAIAKTLAAFGTGLFAGTVTALLPGFNRGGQDLMRPHYLAQASCASAGFWAEAWSSARLVIRWLTLALVLEVFLQRLVSEIWITQLFGKENAASIPLAAAVGAPLYLDGFAALPLVRGMMDMGMSFGAALALLVSGAAVSLYAAAAVVSVVRLKVFVLYVGLAIAGACLAGYTADALW